MIGLFFQYYQLPPARVPQLYEQGDSAMGIWFDGSLAGAIGWNGVPVPAGAQVVLKGRNFASKPTRLFLTYTRFADYGEQVIIIPRLSYDFFPIGLESCGFTLPPFITGAVRVRILADGRWSNEVNFKVQ